MKRITLTIDNGPHSELTPAMLEVLGDRGVRAVFFVVGERVARPGGLELLERIHGAGHLIGNHTWSHRVPFGRNTDPDAVRNEVVRTESLIAPYAQAPPLFRPFGEGGRLDRRLLSPPLIRHLETQGYSCVLWNSVPRDWENPGGWDDTAIAQAMQQDWTVTVVHDIVPGNPDTLARFIDRACESGFEFTGDINPECVPIDGGRIRHNLRPYTRG